MAKYNKIGKTYNQTRKGDPRIFQELFNLLNQPTNKTILDVGAGTGNYANLLANKGNKIVALEPSIKMINQSQDNDRIEWLRGVAENIEIENNFFDSAICILSTHHFKDWKKSFKEINRVLKPNGTLIIYTYLPENQEYFWLEHYFPKLFKVDIAKFPNVETLQERMKTCKFKIASINKYELPHDLKDNFLAASWRNPRNYLKNEIRGGISTFSLLTKDEIEQGVNKLSNDLKNGNWHNQFGDILTQTYFDAGYRFLKIIKES